MDFGSFNEDTAKKILQIPLAKTIYEDFQVWRGEPSREYSVRSAYKLLQETNSGSSNNFIQTENRNFYRKLWNLQIPQKIKITIGKISWNYIPTLFNLKSKKVTVETFCPRCHTSAEDSNHVFRYCATTIKVWSSLDLELVSNNNTQKLVGVAYLGFQAGE